MAITRRMERHRRELEAKMKVSKKVPCRYFDRGNAFCKHGESCYYLHKVAGHRVDKVDVTCHICYETPSKYGIMSTCKHKFCLDCIDTWARQHARNLICPLCRTSARIIVPANYAPTAKQCEVIVQTFLERCSSQKCHWFETRKEKAYRMSDSDSVSENKLWCPDFNDCLYHHELDGQSFTFSANYLLRRSRGIARFMATLPSDSDDSVFDDLSGTTEDIFDGLLASSGASEEGHGAESDEDV